MKKETIYNYYVNYNGDIYSFIDMLVKKYTFISNNRGISTAYAYDGLKGEKWFKSALRIANNIAYELETTGKVLIDRTQ